MDRFAKRIETLKAGQNSFSSDAEIYQTADLVHPKRPQLLSHLLAPRYGTEKSTRLEVTAKSVLGHRIEFFLAEFRWFADFRRIARGAFEGSERPWIILNEINGAAKISGKWLPNDFFYDFVILPDESMEHQSNVTSAAVTMLFPSGAINCELLSEFRD